MRVSGRPSWEALDRNDPYDMGMKDAALAEAKRLLELEVEDV